jgi:uncharacterized membrane protein YciS (DUF1049 family)
MRTIIYLITLAFFAVLAFGFYNMNKGQEVSVKFLGLRMENEFSYFMFIALLLGLIIGAFIMSFGALKYRMRARQANKKFLKAEKEITSLKSVPVKIES